MMVKVLELRQRSARIEVLHDLRLGVPAKILVYGLEFIPVLLGLIELPQ